MRDNTQDKTIYRNYISKWRYMIKDYELIKAKKHHKFRFVSDFYKFHKTNRQTFLKYYYRYVNTLDDNSLLPRRRGPRWRLRRGDCPYVKKLVLEHRKNGTNRYEMCDIINPLLKGLGQDGVSASTVYRIFRRNNMNKLNPKMKENKRRIIKEKSGELGHIDSHHLSKDIIVSEGKRCYLVCVIDDCTRLAWAEVVEDIRSLTVMFSTLRILNLLNKRYELRFEEMMSDNGPEFCSRNNKLFHPFERMLLELGVRHRYTRPYRPQTNGKVERFWRTLNEDLIEGTTFGSVEEFKSELEEYLLYYNELRPHQALGQKTPAQINGICEKAKK